LEILRGADTSASAAENLLYAISGFQIYFLAWA
jgi:hypothetical protein